MKRTVKTIPLRDGKLFAVMDERRVLMCECRAQVDIVERVLELPILGRGRVITNRYAVLLLTFEHRPELAIDEYSISGLDFSGDCLRQDGGIETVRFSCLELMDDLDLTTGGSCAFGVRCSQEMIDRLRKL